MDKKDRLSVYKKIEDSGFILEYNKSLLPFTTIKIGGEAEAFVRVTSKEEFIKIFKIISLEKIPYFLLGGGSNLLISDNGFNGVVVKDEYQKIEYLNEVSDSSVLVKTEAVIKKETHWRKGLLKLDDIDYDESTKLKTLVNVSSGCVLQSVVNKTIENDLTGLQWFSGIPGTIGGAVYNNIHGGTKHFGDFIKEIEVLVDGEVKTVTPKELDMKYDYSLLHVHRYPVISVTLLLDHGNVKRAKESAVEWTRRKAIQPRNSFGSVFKNLDPKIAINANLENPSAGYLIDCILGMKGYKLGKVQVYENHANFIVNNGAGKAIDVYNIVKLIKEKAKKEVGVDLHEEFVYLGEFK